MQKVWTVIHLHGSGVDITLYTTEALAKAYIARYRKSSPTRKPFTPDGWYIIAAPVLDK